jgi:hypothetical protein
MPCAGITKTSTGYDLRLGPDIVDTADKDAKGGLASWTIAASESSAVASDYEEATDVDSEHVADPVAEPVAEHVAEPVADPESPKAPAKKDKKAPVKKAKKAKNADEPVAVAVVKKATKTKKLVVKKKTPVNSDDCVVILVDIERDGIDVEHLLHEQSGKVYNTTNLYDHVATATLNDDGAVVEFL